VGKSVANIIVYVLKHDVPIGINDPRFGLGVLEYREYLNLSGRK
jgi:hypothetical protein